MGGRILKPRSAAARTTSPPLVELCQMGRTCRRWLSRFEALELTRSLAIDRLRRLLLTSERTMHR